MSTRMKFGTVHLNFGGMPQARVIASMTRFAHQVLPRFRRLPCE